LPWELSRTDVGFFGGSLCDIPQMYFIMSTLSRET
jgi:hypothetical protein